MGVGQPYMYHPANSSFLSHEDQNFNPKAASQASWTTRPTRPKPTGPLVESEQFKRFNRHPDSYVSAPYGNINSKTMSRHTKPIVKWTRLLQLLLRICALLGALGMLVCVICIKGTEPTTGWIIRVPPAVAILHTIYAVYHLARSSKGRTPGTSASYMIFAAIIDAGLVPFFVFTAMVTRAKLTEAGDVPGHWRSLFNNVFSTYRIMYATFLFSVVNGAIHLASLIISIYLATIFRNISKLPPDMNPLEANLTSRHKHKNSNMSQTTTLLSSKRESKIEDPLASPVRNVPFMHTRNDSHSNITNVPMPNASPRMSHLDLSERPASDVASHRTSRTNFPNLSQHPRPAAQQPQQSTNLKRSTTKASSIYSIGSESSKVSSVAASLSDDNWITYPSQSPSPSPARELASLRNKATYQPLSQTSPFEYTDENEPPLLPQPLQMHPPTPPVEKQKKETHFRRGGFQGRALTPSTGNWGPGLVGIGKARQWSTGSKEGVTRVVSRSGVEISQGQILPSGGMRAREVSGKIMEEGRGTGGVWK